MSRVDIFMISVIFVLYAGLLAFRDTLGRHLATQSLVYEPVPAAVRRSQEGGGERCGRDEDLRSKGGNGSGL